MGKNTTEWTYREYKRKRGGPKRIWRDDVEEKAGKTWLHVASDRMIWKGLRRSSASSGINGWDRWIDINGHKFWDIFKIHPSLWMNSSISPPNTLICPFLKNRWICYFSPWLVLLDLLRASTSFLTNFSFCLCLSVAWQLWLACQGWQN